MCSVSGKHGWGRGQMLPTQGATESSFREVISPPYPPPSSSEETDPKAQSGKDFHTQEGECRL